jgi:tetratricopeptide (TPR) repeat protein
MPPPAGSDSPFAAARRLPWLGAAALVLAIFLVYQPAWRAGFIWDDDAHLTAHKCIVGPLGFAEIWTTPEANYFPLVLTTWWVVHAIFGLNPVVFHLLTLTLHAACALMLWAVLRRLRIPGAGLGAALWALHPVQVESVAWISETINTQSGLFFLGAVWFWLGWLEQETVGSAEPETRRRNRAPAYALMLACALGALLSKPSTVGLPVALGLCAWWVRGRFSWRDARALVPVLLVALAVSGWAIWEQRVHQQAEGGDWAFSFPERVIVAGRVVWFYLGKLLWPAPLSFIYPRWTLESGNLLAYLPALLAAGGAVWLWRCRETALRPVFFAAVFYGAMVFPVLGFFNVYFFRYAFVADHFAYLPSLGPLVLVGAGLGALARGPRWRWCVLVAGATMLATGAVLGWRHARHFRDDETLWRATLRTNPSCFLALNNLGVLLMNAGQLSEAIAFYDRALATKPEADTQLNKANALAKMPDRFPEARQQFEAALAARPDAEEVRINYANVLAALPGHREEAVAQYEAVLRRNPRNAKAHSNLGFLLGTMPGRLAEAIAHGQQAVALAPELPEAQFNLAKNLERLPERREEAMARYEAAVRLKPDYVKAHINLGLLLAADPATYPAAMTHYEAALRHDPKSAIAHNNLAIVLAQSGRPDEAQAHFERAVQLDPNYAEARRNLELLQAGRAQPAP